MTIFNESGFRGSRHPLANANLVNVQSFTVEQLISIHSVASDLRWAMAELAWRSFTAMVAFVQGRFLSWVRGHRTPQDQEGRGRHCHC